MKALIADDDRASGLVLRRTLERWNFETVLVEDGEQAWRALEAEPAISLAIFDWMMPGLEGPELCRRIRSSAGHDHMYLLLLTTRSGRADMVDGLNAGADDYIVKPFNVDEMQARINVGLRVLALQRTVADRARELQAAASSITKLRRLLPICSYCKKIRSDEDYWQQLEEYLSQQTDLQFSHGVCPGCYQEALAGLT